MVIKKNQLGDVDPNAGYAPPTATPAGMVSSYTGVPQPWTGPLPSYYYMPPIAAVDPGGNAVVTFRETDNGPGFVIANQQVGVVAGSRSDLPQTGAAIPIPTVVPVVNYPNTDPRYQINPQVPVNPSDLNNSPTGTTPLTAGAHVNDIVNQAESWVKDHMMLSIGIGAGIVFLLIGGGRR